MIIDRPPLPELEVRNIAPRQLAHIGDAVYHLFLREQEVFESVSVNQMHKRTTARASAESQADSLDQIAPFLTEIEADVVRRARNVKSTGQRKAGQATYRKSTAFEALLGYLYLTDINRLKELLGKTQPLPQAPLD